jgi:hypothetical protein
MKNFRIEVKWGLIFTVVALLWMLFERLMGWHSTHIDKHAYYTNLFILPAVAVVVMALRDKKANFYGGNMSWKQGFMAGLVITLVITILSPMTQWITHKFITPDYFTNAINYAVTNGKATQEQAEKFFNFNSYLVQSSIGGLVMGLLTSAIVAFFVRTKPGEAELKA